MRKSRVHTHTGECQVCGRRQAAAISSNRIAKHGYTKQWGFFTGTCWGADNLPLELAHDLLNEAIVRATRHIKGLEAEIAHTKALPATHGFYVAWIRDRTNPATGRHTLGIYQRVPVIYLEVEKDFSDGSGTYCAVQIWNREMTERYDQDRDNESIDAVKKASESREKYIEGLQEDIRQVEKYIEWQRTRIREWTQRELTPIAARTV
jgi:hypothetical protein